LVEKQDKFNIRRKTMRITESRLRQIIRQVIKENALNEGHADSMAVLAIPLVLSIPAIGMYQVGKAVTNMIRRALQPIQHLNAGFDMLEIPTGEDLKITVVDGFLTIETLDGDAVLEVSVSSLKSLSNNEKVQLILAIFNLYEGRTDSTIAMVREVLDYKFTKKGRKGRVYDDSLRSISDFLSGLCQQIGCEGLSTFSLERPGSTQSMYGSLDLDDNLSRIDFEDDVGGSFGRTPNTYRKPSHRR